MQALESRVQLAQKRKSPRDSLSISMKWPSLKCSPRTLNWSAVSARSKFQFRHPAGPYKEVPDPKPFIALKSSIGVDSRSQ